MADRSTQRLPALKKALIVADSGPSGIECSVRNLSSEGARIRFKSPVKLPPKFEFLLVTENVRVPAELAWQENTEAGIHFVKPLRWLVKHDHGGI